MKYLFLDSETGGLNPDTSEVLQLAWILTDEQFESLSSRSYFLNMTMPATPESIRLHGLTKEFLLENAVKDVHECYFELLQDLLKADCLVGHYVIFDIQMIKKDIERRLGKDDETGKKIIRILNTIKRIDTKTAYLKLNPRWRQRAHPGPYVNELCEFLNVDTSLLRFHRADSDAEALRLCMRQIKYISSDTLRG